MRLASFVLAVLALTLAPVAGQAESHAAPKVINIVTIDAGGDVPALLEFVKRARAIAQQYGGTGTTRTWQSTLAGPTTGTVAVAVEYPNLVSMAQTQTKIGPSPEWRKFLADFQAAGMRVVSNSVAVEITP